jgi:hypothetical protein
MHYRICQVGPGLLPTSTSAVGVVPFISHIDALVFEKVARGGLSAANLRHASGTDRDCITHCAGDAIADSQIRSGSVALKNSPVGITSADRQLTGPGVRRVGDPQADIAVRVRADE